MMIERTLRGLSRLFAYVGIAAMVLMMLHVTLDVAGKWLFHAPLPVTIEMTSNYYMVAVVFFPLAAVEFRNGHISVELVSQYLSPRVRRGLIAATLGFAALYFSVITARTWHDAMNKFEVGEYLYGTYPLRIWQSRFFVPLGTGLFTLVLGWKALMIFRGADRLVSEGQESLDLEGLE